MTWFGWALICYLALGAVVGVATAPRKGITPTAAAVSLVIDLVIIVGLLSVGTGHL